MNININITALDEGSIITVNGKKIGCRDMHEEMETIVLETIRKNLKLSSMYFEKHRAIEIKIEATFDSLIPPKTTSNL